MKIFGVFVLLLLSCSTIAAQAPPENPIVKGTWELGLFAGGGIGLGKSDNTQFFYAGGRAGAKDGRWLLTIISSLLIILS